MAGQHWWNDVYKTWQVKHWRTSVVFEANLISFREDESCSILFLSCLDRIHNEASAGVIRHCSLDSDLLRLSKDGFLLTIAGQFGADLFTTT